MTYYRWNGPMYPIQGAVTYRDGQGVTRYKNKGIMRAIKAAKRQEAEERNALTPPERQRKTRLAA
jgi:hypothetical protein